MNDRRSPVDRVIPPLAAAAIALIVFRGALPYYFSQDDFAALARAAGLLPRFDEPWRWLSLQAFFDLMRPLAGLNPLPYHAVSVLLHALTAAALALLLARVLGGPAALVGAGFFAAHATSFTAVYWISTVGDLGAVLFALLALPLALRADRGRWLALPLYAASLLCKESVLLLPLCIAAVAAWRRENRAERVGPLPVRDPLLGAMVVVSVAYVIYFARANQLGPGMTAPGGAPYSIGVGRHLLENLLTYSGWALNAFLPTVRGWSDAPDRAVYSWGIIALGGWVVGALIGPFRRRGWIAAGACYVTLLIPVLPLTHHTYHYYLYPSLAALAWCVAAGFDAGASAIARARTAAVSWLAAGALAALLGLNGAALVRKIETATFMHPELRSEPVVDRARIAERVIGGLRGANLPARTSLVFWSPEARAGIDSAGAQTYWERNLRAALYDGVAVRLMVPEVRAVRFATSPPRASDSALVAVYRVTGEVRVLSSSAVDSILTRP